MIFEYDLYKIEKGKVLYNFTTKKKKDDYKTVSYKIGNDKENINKFTSSKTIASKKKIILI